MTTERTPNHMTFNANVSFDLKMVAGMEFIRPILKEMEEYFNDPEKLAQMDTKGKIFCGLVLEGKTEEERVARFLQFKLREGLNISLRDELVSGNDDSLRLTVSPVKFRFVTNEQK
ncbi:MAG: hypothetical protein ACRDCE_20280 [Cetobacterium sp.]|uniref:hypothetical protein n=1 Tax=Cetobacterium sp. TaxID=2071632 RepID=UPI003EE6FAC3